MRKTSMSSSKPRALKNLPAKVKDVTKRDAAKVKGGGKNITLT